MSNEPDPLVLRHARHRSDGRTPLPARLNPPVRHQPLPSRAQSRRSPAQAVTRRRWPRALRVVVWIGSVLLSITAILGVLVLTGQTEFVAWIIVGAVLAVVFGTPLLCVVSLFIWYGWAVTRMGRARQRPPATKTSAAPQVAQTIIVIE
ncbi:hypothetical protein [Candidatus Chloroploca asiatica]|uniref:Uncharacterized protein n=1 Tax=Candidatus Chloroploca asiatica TaxID=1506545 RepID=A0A2H3KR38_9CHLR|nr:hypothetical protein [Candidatus Chloroploca asiatica]PDW00939.1 hypothetical protein A9Q02_21475 [Candidatus Chloroploca asiatica]